MKMTRRRWRETAATAQLLAKAGQPIRAMLHLKLATGADVSKVVEAVRRLQALPEVKA